MHCSRGKDNIYWLSTSFVANLIAHSDYIDGTGKLAKRVEVDILKVTCA